MQLRNTSVALLINWPVSPPFLDAGLHVITVDVVVRDPGAHGHVSRHSRLDGLPGSGRPAVRTLSSTRLPLISASPLTGALEHTGRVGTGAELPSRRRPRS